MYQAKAQYLKCTIHRCGIGGWKCDCCRPGKRHERKVFRQLKRSERQKAIKEIAQELDVKDL
jgi:hypothetical protein